MPTQLLQFNIDSANTFRHKCAGLFVYKGGVVTAGMGTLSPALFCLNK